MFRKDEDLLILAGVSASMRELIGFTYRTGSNYTVNPPVTNTDIDLYAYVNPATISRVAGIHMTAWQLEHRVRWHKQLLAWISQQLAADGWQPCSTEEDGHVYSNDPSYDSKWTALRKGEYNLMVVLDLNYFTCAAAATELCRTLNLSLKEERIKIHNQVHKVHMEELMPITSTQEQVMRLLRAEYTNACGTEITDARAQSESQWISGVQLASVLQQARPVRAPIGPRQAALQPIPQYHYNFGPLQA